MDGILNWKICKECGDPFDIDTSKELCPNCRLKKNKKDNNPIRRYF